MSHSTPSISTTKNVHLWSAAFFLAGFLLSFFYVNNVDLQWLTHEAQLFFSGGHYVTDFIDPNAPLILFIYQPLNIIHHLFPTLPLNIISPVYFYLIIGSSIARCHHLIQKNTHLPAFLAPLIAFLLAVFPTTSFNQRDFLLVALSMPYLLNSLLSEKTQNTAPFLDTVFACVGFLIKIQYMIIPLTIELYLCIRQKKYRPHALLFIGGGITYLLYMRYGTPAYWHDILPMIKRYYFHCNGFSHLPLRQFLLDPKTMAGLIGVTASTITFWRSKSYFFLPLYIASISSFLFYFIPQQITFYHSIPFTTYWVLLSSLLFHQHPPIKVNWKKRFSFSLMIGINLLSSLAITAHHLYRTVVTERYIHSFLKEPTPIAKATRIMPIITSTISAVLSTFEAGKINCSRLSSLWMAVPFLDQTITLKETDQDKQTRENMQQWVMEDIERCHPDLIILNSPIDSPEMKRASTITLFSSNPEFQKLASHYRLAKQYENLLYFVRRDN